jgi:hypothetical protein
MSEKIYRYMHIISSKPHPSCLPEVGGPPSQQQQQQQHVMPAAGPEHDDDDCRWHDIIHA